MIFVLMEGADVCNVYLNFSWLKQFSGRLTDVQTDCLLIFTTLAVFQLHNGGLWTRGKSVVIDLLELSDIRSRQSD